jgi:hypothetical protein
MADPSSHHFNALEKAYQQVAERTWEEKDFLPANLEGSRNLFTPESLKKRQPEPRALEVFALLSGLPFSADFTRPLVEIQRNISACLGGALHYWVLPENLGVEYCVFKWPDAVWQETQRGVIEEILSEIREPSFRFYIGGIQVHADGCVVAKGFDEGGVLFSIRERMKATLPFLPKKQSGWAHVPLGRILEPIGTENYIRLKEMVRALAGAPITNTEITSLKFIHEKRWYMEERSLLAEYALMQPC